MVATTLVSMMVVDLMEGSKGKISNRACDEAVICASKRWEKVEVLETSDGGRRRLLARLLVVVVRVCSIWDSWASSQVRSFSIL